MRAEGPVSGRVEGQHRDETTRPCIIAIVGYDYSLSTVETLEVGGEGVGDGRGRGVR